MPILCYFSDCFLLGGGLPCRKICFSKLSKIEIAIRWTSGSVSPFSLMLYKCCNPPSSINILQYLEAKMRRGDRERNFHYTACIKISWFCHFSHLEKFQQANHSFPPYHFAVCRRSTCKVLTWHLKTLNICFRGRNCSFDTPTLRQGRANLSIYSRSGWVATHFMLWIFRKETVTKTASIVMLLYTQCTCMVEDHAVMQFNLTKQFTFMRYCLSNCVFL